RSARVQLQASAGAVVEQAEGADEEVRRPEDAPGVAVPCRDPVPGRAESRGRDAVGGQALERRDRVVAAGAERFPARTVPARDVARGDAAGCRETPAGVERGSAPVVEDLEGLHDDAVDSAPERFPARA